MDWLSIAIMQMHGISLNIIVRIISAKGVNTWIYQN
jgi:hypothetical protein